MSAFVLTPPPGIVRRAATALTAALTIIGAFGFAVIKDISKPEYGTEMQVWRSQSGSLISQTAIMTTSGLSLSGALIADSVLIGGSSVLTGADADNRYVNTSGDTMTGALITTDVTIPSMYLGDPRYKSINDFFKLFTSAGRIGGGSISDAGSQTVNVASGTGVIRIADDDVSQVKFFEWSSSGGITVPTDTIKYIGVVYNAGSPKIGVRDTNVWNYDTEFPLGSVINQADDLYVLNNPWWVSDGLANIIERIQADGYTIRDNHVGGLILGTTGTRNVTLSSGVVWSRLNEFEITTKDTSGTDTFYAFYRDGATGYTRTAALSQYPVTQYDDNSGTLEDMNANRYANWWVFLEIDETTKGRLMLIYPQNQYSNIATAEAEEVPSFPATWYEHGILVGRILFKQGTDAPVETQSAFVTQFTPAQAADHGNLAGLADDDHPQYCLADGTRAFTGNVTIEGTLTASGATVSPSRYMTIVLTEPDTRTATGTNVFQFYTPFTGQFNKAVLTGVANGSGVTVDVNIAGVSMFSTLLTLDERETTSLTATTGAVLGNTVFSSYQLVTVDIDSCGDTSAGAQCPMGVSLILTASGSTFP